MSAVDATYKPKVERVGIYERAVVCVVKEMHWPDGYCTIGFSVHFTQPRPPHMVPTLAEARRIALNA